MALIEKDIFKLLSSFHLIRNDLFFCILPIYMHILVKLSVMVSRSCTVKLGNGMRLSNASVGHTERPHLGEARSDKHPSGMIMSVAKIVKSGPAIHTCILAIWVIVLRVHPRINLVNHHVPREYVLA